MGRVETEAHSRYETTREIQNYCANIVESGREWTTADAEHIAGLINRDDDPWEYFRYLDEKTGASDVGYRTADGREWFLILRQMRNVGSGLLENLRRDQ